MLLFQPKAIQSHSFDKKRSNWALVVKNIDGFISFNFDGFNRTYVDDPMSRGFEAFNLSLKRASVKINYLAFADMTDL